MKEIIIFVIGFLFGWYADLVIVCVLTGILKVFERRK